MKETTARASPNFRLSTFNAVELTSPPVPCDRRSAFRAAAALAALLAASVPGCAAWFSPFHIPEGRPPDLRFVSRADLGIPGGPLPLDVVFTIHPQIRLEEPPPPPAACLWGRKDPGPPFDRAGAFRSLTQNVLTEEFASAVEEAPGSHERLEDLRRSLGQDRLPDQLPPLNAKALVVVDFRPRRGEPSGLAAQLSVKVYDISYQGYDRLTLFNPRLLIFEDFAEVERAEEASKFPGTIFLAWKEVLGRMRDSRRFQEYLELGREPLDESTSSGAILLGIVPPDRISRAPDPGCHEWIEEEFLFARPVPAPEVLEETLPPEEAMEDGATEPAPLWSEDAGDSDRIGPPAIEGPDGPVSPGDARPGPAAHPREGS